MNDATKSLSSSFSTSSPVSTTVIVTKVYDRGLLTVEQHLPVVRPCTELVQVFLKLVMALIVFQSQVDFGVIHEFDDLASEVNVDVIDKDDELINRVGPKTDPCGTPL
jgi:hypothetical protein